MKKYRKLCLTFLVPILILILIIICFSKQIGDMYFDQKDVKTSIFWYELSYNSFKHNDSLDSLCLSLVLVENDKKLIAYLPKYLDLNKSMLGQKNYDMYIAVYIEVFYKTGDIERYKSVYNQFLDLIPDDPQIIVPLEQVIFDIEATNQDLVWALSILERIVRNSDEYIVKGAGYVHESWIYQRTGDTIKSDETKSLSDKYYALITEED